MKTKPLTFLLALAFLFLFSGSVFADDFQDAAADAYERKDYKEAARLFRLSAEQGNPKAQVLLGLMSRRGEGVAQDSKEAVRLFRLAAEQGYHDGQRRLAGMYQTGDGVLQNKGEAVKWYVLAAEQGNDWAKLNLGTLALNGVPEAVKFFIEEAEKGSQKEKDLYNDVFQALENLTYQQLRDYIEYWRKRLNIANLSAEETAEIEGKISNAQRAVWQKHVEDISEKLS